MDFGWVNRFEAAQGTFSELCDRIMTQPRFPEIFDNIAWFIWSYSVKKINQKKKPEPVLKKEKRIRVRKTKMQKKKQGLNDRSFDLLLRKLLVALKD